MRSISILGLFALIIVFVGAGCLEKTPVASNDNQTVAVAEDNDNYDTLAATNTNNDVVGEVLESDTTNEKSIVSSVVKPSAKAFTYSQAVQQYDDLGYRYQFANCSGLPGTFTIKRGVKFMLDNRDSVRHVIGIGTNKYTVPAYGYAIISVNTPNAYYITCDGGGAAEIKVQK